jgi:hypothetical protein
MNENQNQPESFLFMLQITRKLQSSKNKDRIYALAGFRTMDTNPADFQGPLDSRRRLQSIYEEFAKKVLTRMGTLDILSAVQHDANKPIILKSTWVPRWHIYSAGTIAPLGSKYGTYHACRGLMLIILEVVLVLVRYVRQVLVRVAAKIFYLPARVLDNFG